MRNELCRSVGDINKAPDPINTGLIKTVSTIISDSLNDQNAQPPAWSNKGLHKHTAHQRDRILQSRVVIFFFFIVKVYETEKYNFFENLSRDKQRHLAEVFGNSPTTQT